ncbi:Sugar transferase involved in LPS biosynthesis (colanic, teichoic acid) [Halobacillus alkaliphilus]|uniref:Sugar transferase involved in LPS biosynthesis (Colanic, teichoic acid) n=1 Tax=Halobacillus alkaliphilus TaxID=396056 RepID=A0A1I2JX60_9BACI|nr:sugar transferase [Halobacillus alkaliphilus]SFF58779.1 Sugar transferase involved in LPS biosynthesis (colanic, teichoic acid) [Halobacillus alkaliphilus]
MYINVKNLLDKVFSLLGIIVLSPLLILVAIAIKLDSKGPVFFKQERLGLNGKVFKLYKFRSMCVGAEEKGVYETKGDMRVTRVGRFIRKTSIDEFPQFINILKGEMSMIGPRPTLTYHPWPLEDYTEKQKKRFEVRPGVTGWAQINGRKGLPWNERIKYDVEYSTSCSLYFDCRIFLKTVAKVVFMKDNINTGETVQKKYNK